MRNGAYIRALGRMPFEPSQPAPPPHSEPEVADQDIETTETAPNDENSSPTGSSSNPQPPWTEMQSELASAQNDVLVTVGLCLRESHPRPKEEKMGLLMKENEVGLIVGALDLTAAYLGGWSIISMRSRIQSLRVHEHVRFKDVARMTLVHQNFLDPFVGMPAHLAFQAFSLVTDHLSSRLLMGLARTSIFKNPETGKLRKFSMITLEALDTILQLASWGLAFPLFEYSTLQTLYFAPKWPIFPPVHAVRDSWRHFTATPHSGIFPSWIPSFAVRILDNYVLLSFIELKIFQKIHSWSFDALRRALPRPNNPDQASINAALESDDDIDIEDQESRERRRRRRANVRRRRRNRRAGAILPQEQEQEQEQEGSTTATAGATEAPNDAFEDAEIDGMAAEIDAGDIVEATVTAGIRQSDLPETEEEIIEQLGDFIDLHALPIGTHLPGETTPIHPPRSSSLASSQNARPPQPAPEDSLLDDDMPPLVDVPPLRSLPPPSSHRSQHRLTTLSCHPCDAAASHIADALAAGFTIGMEAIVLRSIARQYLLRQPNGPGGFATTRNWQTGALVRLADVYHPRDFMGGWVATLKSMMVGHIAAWGLWEATYLASTWLGVAFFQYHRV